MAGTTDPETHLHTGSITLQLLGPPLWRRPGGASGTLAPRDAALLALLAVDGPTARDRVAAWLWPDAKTQSHANLSLRQRLFRLRRECGHALVEAGVHLALRPDVEVDLRARTLDSEGVLLAGQDFAPFEAFDQWLQSARLALGARQADGLAGRAATLEERGSIAEAIALVERIVAAWPATEHAWRRLMRLHWLRADRAAAIAAFERFEREVCREHGLRPSAETLALLERLEREETPVAAPRPALPPALVHPPHLVGRAHALSALGQAWAAGRAVLILGVAGLGKSRLLEAAGAGRDGVLQTRARPGDAAWPYATLSHILGEALRRWGPALDHPLRAELARILPQLGPAAAQPVQELQLWQAIEQAWWSCCEQGLQALCIDDLHWADSATLEQLRWQLARPRLTALRVALAARPDEDTPAQSLLQEACAGASHLEAIALAPWTREDIDALLPTLGLPPALAEAPDLAAELMRQTGGQPYFVLETLKTLALAEAGGPWTAPLTSRSATPDAAAPGVAQAVTALIERRVQRLGTGAHQLLQLLAVAGGQLSLQVAGRIQRQPWIELGRDWQELAAAQLVQESGVTHDLVRECVLAMLPAPTRQALHLTVAEGLSLEPGIDQASLAPHWEAGHAWSQAGHAWRQAADAASRAGRLLEADALYGRAADCHLRGADESALVACLTAAHPTRLMKSGAEAELATLAPHLERIHEPLARIRLLLLQADAEMSRMQPQAAVVASSQAWQLVQQLPVTGPLQVDCAMEHGRALAWAGQIDDGVSLLRRACEDADASGDLRLRLRARCTLNDVLVPAGERMESVRHQREALALTRQLGDRFETAVCASNLAVFELLVGHAEAAYEAGLAALEAFAEMQAQHVNRLMCASSFAFAAAHLGRFDEVARHAAPLADGDRADPVRRALCNVLSTVALWRGHPQEAAELLPPPDDDSPLSVRVTGVLARLRWCAWTGADDRPDRARLHALGERHPALREDAHFYRGWALWDPPSEALPRLDRLAAAQSAAGAHDLARSLEVVALQIALEQDDADAAARARALYAACGSGTLTSDRSSTWHPALYPPEVLVTLAAGLHRAGMTDEARGLEARARAWIRQARLPNDRPETRAAFESRNPVNRGLGLLATG